MWPLGSELPCSVAQDAPEQLPTGVPGDDIDKFDPTLEVLVLRFVVGDMLHGTQKLSSAIPGEGFNHTFVMLALIFSASPEAARLAASAESTTKANGNSPLYSSGIPTTQVSAMSTCRNRWPSSSAGATWNARTFSSSYEETGHHGVTEVYR